MEIINYFNLVKSNFENIFSNNNFAPKNILQIGSFTGDCSKWLLERFPDSMLYDVDTLCGSTSAEGNLDKHEEIPFSLVIKKYINQVKPYKNRLVFYKGTSDLFFNQNNVNFDFIYIDGNHKAEAVYKDARNAWKFLNHEGIIAFDDYLWNMDQDINKIPYQAIINFYTEHKDECKVLIDNYQFWIQKVLHTGRNL